MIKFFRQIRQRMIKENRVSKYLLYALGEIFLVVIGILLALQINNWNTERVQEATMHNYLARIHAEVEEEIKVIEDFVQTEESLEAINFRTLKILDSQNRDSIPALKETIGALGTGWTVGVQFPVLEEFIEQGYLSKIESDSLKLAFKLYSYSIKEMQLIEDGIMDQYNHRIEPYINKHINYSEVALSIYKKRFVEGGPPTDFEFLFNDMEFWNIVTFKVEITGGDILYNKRVVARLKNLNAQIENELNCEL